MMRQYHRIKASHPDAILFFRLGDFYEMFFDDAVVASEILDITLTARNRGTASEAPMCGVPHHSADAYLAKLLDAGMKVAIADVEQAALDTGGFDVELAVLPAQYVFPLPEGLDPVTSAAAPLAFLTAWGMLHSRAAIREGETVLVIAGTSGVGSAAIQLARAAGAQVIATAGSEAKRELCAELGAEAVLDHHDPDWPKGVRSVARAGADVVIEHVGPATWKGSMRALARNGRLVTCGGTTGPEVPLVLPHLFIKNQSVLGSTMGPRHALPEIFDHLAAGRVRSVVDRVMPMSEVRQAHQLLEDGEVLGKIVLVPGE